MLLSNFLPELLDWMLRVGGNTDCYAFRASGYRVIPAPFLREEISEPVEIFLRQVMDHDQRHDPSSPRSNTRSHNATDQVHGRGLLMHEVS
jgi:hypothetical protein